MCQCLCLCLCLCLCSVCVDPCLGASKHKDIEMTHGKNVCSHYFVDIIHSLILVSKVIGSDAVNRYFLVMVFVWGVGLHNTIKIFLHMFNNLNEYIGTVFLLFYFLVHAWFFFPQLWSVIIQIFFSFNKREWEFES